MFQSILSKVGWGDLPKNFGYSIGEKAETLPVPRSIWELHHGKKSSDGSAVSIFVCDKKKAEGWQVNAAKTAVQTSKTLRHPNILRALDSCDVGSGVYLVTEAVVPLLSQTQETEPGEGEPAVWGLYQAVDALGFLHVSGLVHGLFGPHSVFVTPSGDYRLGGFEACGKGLTGEDAVRAYRGQGLSGWPEPPSSLSSSGVPGAIVDLWGVAVMTAYVFSAARTGSNFRLDLGRAANDLPAELRRPFAALQGGERGGKGNTASAFLEQQFFQKNASVRVMSFLSSLHIKSSTEKDAFFESLPSALDQIPKGLQTKQVLSELMVAQRFPGQEAAQVLPSILKIGIKLTEEMFKARVAPLVVQLFAAPDRAVRFRLLSSLGDMIDHLDDSMINDKIFPECVNGFTDSSGPIREATVKALIHFVPRLKAKTVETRIPRLLLKLLQDPEASIRTNAVICCGRIVSHLPQAAASQMLMQALAAGLKDPFSPCRSASLHTLTATVSTFTPEDLVGRVMPSVCVCLIDPDPGVGDAAFEVVSKLQAHLKQQVKERRAAQATDMSTPQSGSTASTTETESGRWGSWALTTVGSLGQGIMGSMKPWSKNSVDGAAGGETPLGAPATAQSFGTQGDVSSAAPSAGGQSVEPKAAVTPMPAQSGGQGAWDESDFWDEFGDVPPPRDSDDDEHPAEAQGFSPAPRPAASAPAAKEMQKPAPETSMGTKPAPGKGMALGKASAKAPAKAASNVEDDFWKEFDM